MSQDQITGIIRAILTIAGTYLFGHNLFGAKVDESLWQEVSGCVMVVAAFVWSIATKTLTLEIFQSSILKVITVVGMLLVTSGKLAGGTLTAIATLATTVLPIIYSILSKKKSAAIATGDVTPSQLSK